MFKYGRVPVNNIVMWNVGKSMFLRNDWEYIDLKKELFALCKEWRIGQIKDLDPSELPSDHEMRVDDSRMANDIFASVQKYIEPKGDSGFYRPVDSVNLEAHQYASDIKDSGTPIPIFYNLVINKLSDQKYLHGNRLCIIKILLESFLNEKCT